MIDTSTKGYGVDENLESGYQWLARMERERD
jgi:hypothetical protein